MDIENSPKVTVYITNYNYGRFIKQAIQSVLDQKYLSWELIIIDDGSADNSREVIAKYENNPKIRVVYQANKGLATSNNIALRLSRGRYIMRLDADDYLDENALVVLANVLDHHPEVGLVYPDYYRIDQDGNIIDIQRRNKLDREITLYDIPAHGACTLIRKECLLDIGGYKEDIRCQDGYDLWLRFIAKFKVYNVNVPLFYYRQHGRNLTSRESEILSTRHRIKRRHVSESAGLKAFGVLGIIPVRGKKYGEPSYALKNFNGRRLIDYTIQAALKSDALSGVVVVSESKEVRDYVKRTFKDVLVMTRPREYSKINSPIEPTVKYVLESLKGHGKKYDALAILYANCPLRKPMHIQKAVDTMLIFDTDCVLSVYQDTHEHYQHLNNGLEPLFPKRMLRLEREALLVANGAIYLARTRQLAKKDFISGRIGHIVMTRNESFKIDTEEDMAIVEKILEEVNPVGKNGGMGLSNGAKKP